MRKGRMMYVPPTVLEELTSIQQAENINKRRDAFNKMVEHTRIGREMEKINLFKKRKASVQDVPFIVVMLFVFSIGFFIAYYAINTMSVQITDHTIVGQDHYANETIQAGRQATGQFDYVIFLVFIGLALSIIISAWFVAGNGIFMFIYFLVIAVSVALSAIMANVWESASQMSIFGTTLLAFPIANNLMLNLPMYCAIIGFLGLTVMFGKPFIQGMQ